MNLQLIQIIGISVGIFTSVKFFFGLLGWYTKDFQDPIYRKQLDHFWEQLNKKSLYLLAHDLLQILVKRLEKIVIPNKPLIGIIFFLLNYSLFWGASIWVDNTEFEGKNLGVNSLSMFGEGEVQLIAFSIGMAGMIVDFISLSITIWLIKRAALSQRISGIAKHVILDLLFACMSAVLLITVTSYIDVGRLFYDDILSEEKLVIFSLIIGVTSTIPSSIYALIALTVIFLWSIPEKVQFVLNNIIFRLTTDKNPVLTQLGYIMGGISGLLGGILTAMKVFAN